MLHRLATLACLLAILAALPGCGRNPFTTLRPEGYAFPSDFVWGVAVAAHQVEGGNDKNDWWEWEQKPGAIKGGDKSGDGVAFAKTFAEDATLARSLGQTAFRLSLEWSRIEPERGRRDPAALKYYHDVLAALKANGLRPFVTLMHFTLPNWVAAQGGWENAKTLADFEAYSAFCAKEFGAEVDDWITINEPNVYAFNSYDGHEWPPGKQNRQAAMQVMGAQMVGHARSAAALRANDTVSALGGRACRVGIANHLIVIDPANGLSPLEHVRAYFEDRIFNEAFLEAVRTGVFVAEMPGSGKTEVRDPGLKDSVDFVGINYYRRVLVNGLDGPRTAAAGAATNDLGWEINPDGLYRILSRVSSQKLPIYITENGTADAGDKFRARFVVQHLMRVWQAIDAGIPVKGYFHWSLMDNFEWAEGYSARFGLYRVDFAKSNRSRELTRGAEVYRAICKANKLSPDLIRQYGL
jgi:beta-glucosidase